MNSTFKTKDSFTQQGLTLIELMIAMLLGILLLLGITQMFMTNKRIYKEQEYMSRMQENARFALNLIMYDIRMAGYTGCSDDVSSVENHVEGNGDAANLLSFSNAVEGSESGGDWQPSGSSDQVSNMVANTDGISIRYLEDSGLKIEEPYMVNNAAALHVTVDNGLVPGEIVGVADCQSADIFSVSNNNPDSSGTVDHNTGNNSKGPDNVTKELQKKYLGDASIVKFVSRRYIIQNGANGRPALWRYLYAPDTSGNIVYQGQELIPGVQNMQILYGEDTSGDKLANVYRDAANVQHWDKVVSVRIAFLFETVDENNQIEKDTQSHALLGGTGNGGYTVPAADDYRRRRVFTTTIQIRNRST